MYIRVNFLTVCNLSCTLTFTVYVYVDASDDNRNFPEEIKSKYIVTRELGAGACGKVYLVFEKVNVELTLS